MSSNLAFRKTPTVIQFKHFLPTFLCFLNNVYFLSSWKSNGFYLIR